MHTHLITEAKNFADDNLPESHPMATLTRRLSQSSAVCAEANAEAADRTPTTNADSSLKLPQVEEPRRSSSGSASLRPKTLSAAEQDCGGAGDDQDDSSRVFERPS